MTNLECQKCKKVCIFKARPKDDEVFGAPCDSCKNMYCKDCSSITTTEAHAIALSQRSLMYLCIECKKLIKDLPNLKKTVEMNEKLRKDGKRKDVIAEKLELKLNKQIMELEEENRKLCKEAVEKSEHIKRIRRNTQDFEECVLNTEQSYIDSIKEQKEKISDLNKEIIDLLEKGKILTVSIQDLETKTRAQSKEINDLNTLKNQMLVSIETLTKDNETYINELKKSNYELFTLRNSSIMQVESVNSPAQVSCINGKKLPVPVLIRNH